MKIRLLKHAQIGQSVFRKGWEGEVTDEQGNSVINARRGVEIAADVDAQPAKKATKKKAAKPLSETLD